MTDERVLLLERMAEVLGENGVEENTWAALIDRALRHYVESVENFESIRGEITPDQARTISTSELRVQQQSYVVIPNK